MSLIIDRTKPVRWESPKTPVEALEIALQLAENEEQWSSGEWCTFDPLSVLAYTHGDDEARDRDQALARADIGSLVRWDDNAMDELPVEDFDKVDRDALPDIMCTDFRACAAGLLIVAIGDGISLTLFYRNRLDTATRWLAHHPIGGPAACYLAAGIDEKITGLPVSEGDLDMMLARPVSAIELIINRNDDDGRFTRVDEDTGEQVHDRKAHHAAIVAGFRRGLELARKFAPEAA